MTLLSTTPLPKCLWCTRSPVSNFWEAGSSGSALLLLCRGDVAIFEPFGRVEREERYAGPVILDLVGLSQQRHVLQEGTQPFAGRLIAVVLGNGAQLEDVVPALLTLIGAVPDIHLIAHPPHHQIEQIAHALLRCGLTQLRARAGRGCQRLLCRCADCRDLPDVVQRCPKPPAGRLGPAT